MGDIRFQAAYRRLEAASDPAAEVRALADAEVVAALAATSRRGDALLANVLGTEALNRVNRWTAVMQHMIEGVVAVDAEGRITFANAAAERLLGRLRADIVGRDAAAALVVRDAEGRAIPAAERPFHVAAVEGREIVRDDVFVERADGAVFPARIAASPLVREGDLVGAVVAFHDESEERARREALVASETRYRSLFHATPAMLFTVALDGRIVEANAEGERLMGFRPGELVGRNYLELVHPDDRPRAVAQRQAAQARGTAAGEELRKVRKDGGILWVREFVRADAVGEALLVVCEDITHLKETARDLARLLARAEASEKRYRTILHLHPDPAFVLDAEGRVTEVNPAAERATRSARADVLDAPFAPLVAPQDRARFARDLRRALGGTDEERRYTLLRADGGSFLADVRSAPLAVDGAVEGVLCVARPVPGPTEVRAEQEKLSERARQQAVVAQLGMLALRGVDLRSLLDLAVTSVADTLRVEFAEILALQPEGDLLLVSGAGWKEGNVGKARVGNGAGDQAGYTLANDAPVVVRDLATEARFASSPLLREHGVASGMSVVIQGPPRARPYGVFGIHTRIRRDFTEDDVNFLQSVANVVANAIERARTEEALREANRGLEERVERRTSELQRRNEELEAFSYSASHDLRAPLRGISSLTRALEEDLGPRLLPDERQVLERLRSESDRLGRLVQDLLALSRVGRAALHVTRVDLTAIAEDVARALRAVDPAREIEVRVAPALAACADPDLARALLENLVGNAFKYTRRTARPLVEVGGGDGVFYVRDNGIGFPPEKKAGLFVPFSRLHGGEFEGTGIGLATVRRIVERHGGRVWAESAGVGRGATFWFTLPRASS